MADYIPPSIPALLTLSSFLYLLNIADALSASLLHAGLLGPLFLGIIFGPQAADLLPASTQSTFIVLGYIGLTLLVFDAGLSTDVNLLRATLGLSFTVALTGVLLPIGLSLLILHVGYGYALREAFAAGAALCSTSLGTALSLLDKEAQATRVGAVLVSAALLDDVVGLVIAAIISQLSSNAVSAIPWQAVVRPVLVSVAFACGTPVLAYGARLIVANRCRALSGPGLLFVLVATLSGFVAGASYAGTSGLFGAYLAGAFLTYAFTPPPGSPPPLPAPTAPHIAFVTYLHPPLHTVLAPVFFASIGTALPVRALGAVGRSHAVVWRGIVYAGAMVLAKALVGLWMLVWPERGCARARPRAPMVVTPGAEPKAPLLSPRHSALVLGLAMVARGEIALIVAQLARPLLGAESFAVVIWAILLTTVGGAVGVGWALRRGLG